MQAPAPFNFVHSNRRVICAWDGVDRVGDLAREHGAKRPALVMDVFFQGGEVESRVTRHLQTATGTAPACHFVPAHEPDTTTIEACAATLRAADPDFIVVIGGGSAMDTAKVARLLLSNPGPAEAIAGFGKTFNPHASLLVAVPTTAGTGSEVSESAIASKEGAEIMTDYKGMPALDAGLLAAAQAVEHHEMSRYGTLRTWAEELGMPAAVALLEATLKEEKATDAALTTLAKSVVNVEAEHAL